MKIEAINQLTHDELTQVNRLLHERLQSDIALINQMSRYIIMSGGKRLRPQLLILSALACGYKKDQHLLLAAIIELIHTATLLHDDVVDASQLRRGQETANEVWGNEASVLVGDFLYSRAFELMVETQNMRVMEILAHATNNIAKGEVMQLMNCQDPDTSEARYMQVIKDKTAQLFSAAGKLGAVISDNPQHEAALGKYGQYLGTAFQLIDDVMDYTSSSAVMGKNIGDDLVEGKPTLPLIYAINHGSASQSQLVKKAIAKEGKKHIEDIIQIVRDTGGIDYTQQQAMAQAKQAALSIATLPDSPYRRALAALATLSVERQA